MEYKYRKKRNYLWFALGFRFLFYAFWQLLYSDVIKKLFLSDTKRTYFNIRWRQY